MDIKILIDCMAKNKIDAIYRNDNLVTINGISIYINNGMAHFGTCKFRFVDVYDVLSGLHQEGLIFVNTEMKHKIQSTYREMLHSESKSKV